MEEDNVETVDHQADKSQARLQYDRDELVALRQSDASLVRPNALALEFFREQRDGDQLWSPEAWTSARTQGESGDPAVPSRERGSSIVLGPATRRNWSSGCGTQQSNTRNRELSGSENPPSEDAVRPPGAFRSTSDRENPRFRDFAARGGTRNVSAEPDSSFTGAFRGRSRPPVAQSSTFSSASRGRVRLDQTGLRSNQLFEGLLGSRGKESEGERRPSAENERERSDRPSERNFERERFERDHYDRDRGGLGRGGYRRDREAPYNAALTGSGDTGRFGPRRSRFDDEPEWLSGGPKDAFDCLELHGLPEDEERGREANDEPEEIMMIGDDEDDMEDEETFAEKQRRLMPSRAPPETKPPPKYEAPAREPLHAAPKKEESAFKFDEPKDKRNEPSQQLKSQDVDLSKLAGSRFVKWVQPANDDAGSMRITVVNSAGNQTVKTPQTPTTAASNSPSAPSTAGAATSKSTAISLNDIFMRSNPPAGPNSSKPPASQVKDAKTVQELEIALGIKNDPRASAQQPNKMNALLASMASAPNANAPPANAPPPPSAAANRIGKPISMQVLFGNAQPAAPNQGPAPSNSSNANNLASLGLPQTSVANTKNQPHPQPQLSESVQKFFQAQSAAFANSQHPPVSAQMQMQLQRQTGSNGGSGSHPASPTASQLPTGLPAQSAWQAPVRPPSNLPPQSNPRQSNSQVASQSAPESVRSQQVANVVNQLTNVVMGKFNASQAGTQQREQAAAAFSANVVQAAVQMFVNQLLKSLDNPASFFAQLEAMRNNLPGVIRQFVASGIDPQLAEQFLNTILSVAPYAVTMLGQETAQQPTQPSNSAAQQTLPQALLAQQLRSHELPPHALPHQQNFPINNPQNSQMQLPHVGHHNMSLPPNYLNVAQQQQQMMIEASLAKRAAMNNAPQPQATFAQASQFELSNTATTGSDRRPVLSSGGFVPTQVLRQLAGQQKMAATRATDADDGAQQPAMRPITKGSRDAMEASVAAQMGVGGQYGGASNANANAMLLRHQAFLAAVQQSGASQPIGKP